MRVITWNIQWGRGADGRVDIGRTIAAIDAMGAADVICLQEVARNFPGLKGGAREDLVERIASAFSAYEPVFGAALDVPDGEGGRACFGNLLLSRLPVGQVFRHLLPSPEDGRARSMQRGCVEAVVHAPSGPLRVLTTHLGYYSSHQRVAQIAALRAHQEEVAAHALHGPRGDESKTPFAQRPRPVRAVLCGDFNCEPESAEYQLIGSPSRSYAPQWRDAWRVRHASEPHAPTVGVQGAEWPGRAYCCDYLWVSEGLAERVTDVLVNRHTPASDHQPLLLELDA